MFSFVQLLVAYIRSTANFFFKYNRQLFWFPEKKNPVAKRFIRPAQRDVGAQYKGAKPIRLYTTGLFSSEGSDTPSLADQSEIGLERKTANRARRDGDGTREL